MPQVILKIYDHASSSKINFSKRQPLWGGTYKNGIVQPEKMK